MYHEKIDRLLDTYARKLAENMNQGYAIDARVPSADDRLRGLQYSRCGKKEKQNRARHSNMEEWRHIQGPPRKESSSTGMGGISAHSTRQPSRSSRRSCDVTGTLPSSL